MKKIRSLVVGALLVGLYTMMGTAAYALVQPEVGASVFTFTTAQLNILIGTSSGGPFAQELVLPATEMLLSNDEEHIIDFWVKNASSNGISYALTGQLSEGDQDWDVLKKAIQVKMSNLSEETRWYTLEEAVVESIPFPGLLENGARRYQFIYRLPAQYPVDPDGSGPLHEGDPIGEELEQKITNGIYFLITGHIQGE
ncbi:hypothetical protein LRY58_00050 [Candidatus Woesebacteria bacterium]|nr:hypothetical protein [Candidatus Woesebacteria bacterium]MCD8546428.1 hypothetical protein [Candidatus Woesebacteria bacterium]